MKLSLSFKVHGYESDVRGAARVTSLLNYLQESAWTHAEALGVGFSHLLEKNLAWVLGRLRLEIDFLPQWGETIVVETWPSGRDRLYCYRDFRLLDGQKRLFAAATTSWLAVDLDTRRPQRTDSYIDLPVQVADRAFAEFAPKLPPLDPEGRESSATVCCSHLDVNGHMNNVKYLELVLDSFPFDFCRNRFLQEVSINFINEALPGERLLIRTAPADDGAFAHLLVRANDGLELCRMRTKWSEYRDVF